MPSLWLPGVPVVPSSHDGGSMLGSARKMIWHTYEAPYSLTAYDAAKRLIAAGNEVHFTFNPRSGQLVQILPANRAGRGLRNYPGGVQTNRDGAIAIQVEVIAYAKSPWTSDLTPEGTAGLAKLMAFVDSWGVPRVWPAGDPPAYPYGRSSRNTTLWLQSGHFGHSEVPENTHGDPGDLNVSTLFATLSPQPKPPAPKPPAPKPTTKVSVKGLQAAVHVTRDGVWGPITDRALYVVRYAAYAHTYPWGIKELQRRVGASADGIIGPETRGKLTASVKQIQTSLNVTADGDWGPITNAAFNAARKANKR